MKMKNFKRIIGIILIGMTMCGCGSNIASSEISINDSEQEVTILKSGIPYIDNDAIRTLATYSGSVNLKEFIPTHAVYFFKNEGDGYSYSAALIGPNGYNCLYNEEGYIYESVTNVIVYDFR
jgi:hypothetical protein